MGGTDNTISLPSNSFMIIDGNDNITRSATLMMGKANYPIVTTAATPLNNGDIYFLNYGKETLQLQPGYAYHSYFIKLDKNDKVKWAKQYGSYGKGRYFYAAAGQNNTLAIIGDELGTAYAGFGYFSDKIMFSKIDSSGGDEQNSCGLYNGEIVVKQNTMQAGAFTWNVDSIASAQAINSVPTITTIYTSVFYTCPKEFVDSCSFIQINGPSDICNLNDAYVYKTHRNVTCNQPVIWDIPANATVLDKSDTALTLKFTALGNYFVGAALPYTCSPVKDSVYVTVGLRTPPLYLGADTSLCAGNSMALHAGSRYSNYRWQDGSTDSVFKVTNPGSYWVKVSDSCGNILSDTIRISSAARVPLSIGADRTKCNNDTLQINAPSGFLNYSWSNNYNISSLNSRTVIVNPGVDTSYYLKAEKTPGCFGFDTIAIKVNHSPKIDIGADTSICKGDSVTINAGNSFVTYLWSNGSSTSKITAGSKGSYSVIGTTSDGCKSYDTLQLVSVFNNPVVQLNKDSSLCAGTIRTLDAGGNYASYLWSDGSRAKTFTIKTVGIYSIKVKDANGCVGEDSVTISRLLEPPRNFLTADTSICSYGSLVINSLNTYGSYLWNTNEITKSIIVKQPGNYTLQVVDNNNCMGADTIHVSQKQCLEGIYVPSAFTPNGDGKNDVFKPHIFGNVVSYRLVVYNRYGGKIFETSDLQKGWSGNTGNASFQTGGYVWICRFRLGGQQERLEKGVVMIVR